MINTKELEKRWYKYKIKNVLLVLLLIFLLLALPYGIYYIFDYFTSENNVISETKTTLQPNAEAHKQGDMTLKEYNESNEPQALEEETKQEVFLSPTIPIVDLEQEKRNDQKNQKIVKQHKAPKKELVQAKAFAALTPAELAVIQGRDLPRERKNIKFQTNNDNYIEVMKEKFAKNKNPREALLLAKAYYKSGDYNRAESWALRANKLDQNLAESWFVFTKAKAKLGKYDEALSVLVSYYKSSKSPKAKELIEKIKARSI